MQRCALAASADGPRVVPTTQLQREHDNDLAKQILLYKDALERFDIDKAVPSTPDVL